ncbi:hypothetical protein G3N59_32170 [Paraburkholderia sp. Ac-20340]|uniref:hypothetical protein n=1 Tax=Paraburkholderia sp. Ac-20340 TaxID=2703888 RepID=UPI00197CE89D|nr:hypothetical protein [Paraburkholderia sp. Ac-20340]MBN3858053.1 hypothetical protein [Paraburkholderia sp. Ac-20340]
MFAVAVRRLKPSSHLTTHRNAFDAKLSAESAIQGAGAVNVAGHIFAMHHTKAILPVAFSSRFLSMRENPVTSLHSAFDLSEEKSLKTF